MIVSGDRSIDGARLDRRALQAAAGFAGLGLGSGSVVALLMRNDFAFFEAANAAGMIGAFSVPINWHFAAEEVGHILQDSGAEVLVAHADLLPAVASAVPPHVKVFVVPTPSELVVPYGIGPARYQGGTDWDTWVESQAAVERSGTPIGSSIIVYTSGTTGRPKGVRRGASHDAAQSAARAVAELFDFRADARTAVTGPMYHSAVNGYALGMASVGADLWLMPRFDAEGLLAMIERHRLTHLHMVPIMFVRLLKLPEATRARYDISSLRHIVHAAAPCPPDVKRRMIEWWGPIIHEYFGSTETRMIAACNSAEWLAHPGTVGRVLPETDIAILDEEGHPLPPGTPGEIYARNRAVEDFSYVGDPDKRRSVDRDGLVTSGDVGYVNAEGFLFICDRRRDMINSGGVNIYPAEIEACLLQMEGVQDCAVFGIPDDEYGESVAAVIQTPAGGALTAERVRDHVRARLARYKAPKLVDFVDRLPREDSGKIAKRLLRDPYWQAAGRRI